jgi:hypothetical protein
MDNLTGAAIMAGHNAFLATTNKWRGPDLAMAQAAKTIGGQGGPAPDIRSLAATGATSPASKAYGNGNEQRRTESTVAMLQLSPKSLLGSAPPNNVFLINNAGHNLDGNGASHSDKGASSRASQLALPATQVIAPMQENPTKAIAQAAQNPTLLGDANQQTLSPMTLQKKKPLA